MQVSVGDVLVQFASGLQLAKNPEYNRFVPLECDLLHLQHVVGHCNQNWFLE